MREFRNQRAGYERGEPLCRRRLKDSTAVARQTDAFLRVLSREAVGVSRMIGKGLVALGQIDGFAALGMPNVNAYAREALGYTGNFGRELVWMERPLQRYPCVDRTYADGLLTFSHARLLLRDILVEDELRWADAAQNMSVAELEEALKEWKRRGHAPPSGEVDLNGYPISAPE